ncbi:cadmium-translocating P-type ATPase, partial [Parvimonas sp. M13]|nr:cadmium-translocating P-type ATPase [Parvimonas sp. M13]
IEIINNCFLLDEYFFCFIYSLVKNTDHSLSNYFFYFCYEINVKELIISDLNVIAGGGVHANSPDQAILSGKRKFIGVEGGLFEFMIDTE